MTIDQYVSIISGKFKQGNSSEHTYRGTLEQLIESIVTNVKATNEPKRQKCGAPDYIITKKEIPVGYIETKDIGDKDLEGARKSGNKEQFDRYKKELGNLIFTDYLDFHFYRYEVFVTKIAIAKITDKGIEPIPENFASFSSLLVNFCEHIDQTIKSSQRLAHMMAVKARKLGDTIEQALLSDEETDENSTLKDQLEAFKQILIHDITPKGFADVYAQTIAYGMFAARLHDPTLPTFSREEAATLIPKSNPFLRKLFGYIAGPDLDDRIKWIVDDLVQIFLACNVEEILKNYGRTTQMEDPIIHFYETFLSEYDPKLRKARGVWYTPAPVVNFIVRAVDDILKAEFDLADGLADRSKIKITTQQQGQPKPIEQEVHRVQILDPATGTGTFLAEVIKHIHKKYENIQGAWPSYVEGHLLPRLNGFELLMASYAMAHLKLDLLLTETGYKASSNQRFNIYLTNSLEQAATEVPNLFMAQWLTEEASKADIIKRDTPVMCIIGNPPYSLSSSNKGKWIENLTNDYKQNLNEQNLNSLSDDYVKFIRFSQHYIEKNGSGIVAMVTNNSFIDGITQKQMRKSLLSTFDKIYIYDLHGSAKRKETDLDGSRDENVFDIQQGVSISLFIKNRKSSENKRVLHFDSFGLRKTKYEKLVNGSISNIKWSDVNFSEPNWFFVPKDDTGEEDFIEGFHINDLFIVSGNGIKFRKDNLLVKTMFTEKDVIQMLDDVNNLPEKETYLKYNFEPTPDWNLLNKKQFFIQSDYDSIIKVDYRQFDFRYTYYPLSSINQIIVRGDSRKNLMKNYVRSENLGLVIGRQGQAVGNMQWNLIFICNKPTDMNIFYRGGGINFPLYLYPETSGQQSLIESQIRQPNLKPEIVNKIAEQLGLKFTNEKEETAGTFAPIDILDYIYAVLHSPNYREKYKEFLKIDFPRVPYPKDQATFWQLVKIGGELRQIHLLESSTVERAITPYNVPGDNLVTKPVYKDGNVYINESQYFANVPAAAWNFYIGGYQPAQKWLKDRKDRHLDFDDILHYQKIIVALVETDRLMGEVDRVFEI